MTGSDPIDLSGLRVLLCDADDNLFPSEVPAFDASTEVTNAFLRELEVPVQFTPDELRLRATGRNFRAVAVDLCLAYGVPVEAPLAGSGPPPLPPVSSGPTLTPALLEEWVAEERRHVTAHLGRVLRPDPVVRAALDRIGERLLLAAVSSSASARLEACFAATELDERIPAGRRYSAEDSLPVPASKPDPAVYQFAGRHLGCAGAVGLAVEDSLAGVRSAVAAGFPTVGNVTFVPEHERPGRVAELRAAGADAVVTSWPELVDLLAPVLGGG